MTTITALVTVLASGFGVWALFKYIILTEMRIDANTFKTLHELCKNERNIVLQEEFVVDESRHPNIWNVICIFKDAPWFYLSHSERLLTAGFEGKDYITTVICFRWKRKEVRNFLSVRLKAMQNIIGVPVVLMTPHYFDRIGTLKETLRLPIVDESLWKDFESEVAEVAEEKRQKTSALLYGPPGNGKTSLVKYLAIKHRLPIMIVTFSPDWSNHHLLLLFSQIPKKCIVLLEDFDNYFDGRKCILGSENIKFTFDIILNGLDGVYNTYEHVVFIMTVNDINKVDPALRNRPSRFKYTRCFDNPPLSVRQKILLPHWAEMSDGLNLDQVFRMKEYYDLGLDYNASLKRLEKEMTEDNIKQIAYRRFEERGKIDGGHEEDWHYAKNTHATNGSR